MFRITSEKINGGQLRQSVQNTTAGALVTFEGLVRDTNEGRQVTQLDYEAYKPLAEKEGMAIVEEAKEKFALASALCIHRTGSLGLGETAVWIGCASAHRDEAFSACRYIIDEIKKRVPIWKKELYRDGDSGWINCSTNAQEEPPA